MSSKPERRGTALPPAEERAEAGDVPTSDPYETLELSRLASGAEVRKAYLRAALKHHPDKNAVSERATAHALFRRVVWAYAVLSDPARRARYDATGEAKTESAADDDSGDDPAFSWAAFYSAQFKDAISPAMIDAFRRKYQRSDDERADVLAAYVAHEGDMTALFEVVMLSEPRADEDRFRTMIEQAIAAGDVPAFHAFTHESTAKRRRRARKAAKEEQEAREYARELGLDGVLNRIGDGGGGDGSAQLAALIQQRSKTRHEEMLARLEGRYLMEEAAKKERAKARSVAKKAGKEEKGNSKAKATSKTKAKPDDHEPGDARIQTRRKGLRKRKSSEMVDDEDEDEDEEEEDEDEEEKGKSKTKAKANSKAKPKSTSKSKVKPNTTTVAADPDDYGADDAPHPTRTKGPTKRRSSEMVDDDDDEDNDDEEEDEEEEEEEDYEEAEEDEDEDEDAVDSESDGDEGEVGVRKTTHVKAKAETKATKTATMKATMKTKTTTSRVTRSAKAAGVGVGAGAGAGAGADTTGRAGTKRTRG
ncbi:MAG: hypothetical protein M1826_000547 [Phylliscum demangeonii]|nr:MAG: hypothetical protein M1826_000547 [Phylliscum demangeonii]